MTAIRVRAFGPPEAMRLEEVPDPAPGPGQVLVRVRAAGVNPVETYIRSGTYPRRPALPYTPGNDAAGIVEAVRHGTGPPASRQRLVRPRGRDRRALCDRLARPFPAGARRSRRNGPGPRR